MILTIDNLQCEMILTREDSAYFVRWSYHVNGFIAMGWSDIIPLTNNSELKRFSNVYILKSDCYLSDFDRGKFDSRYLIKVGSRNTITSEIDLDPKFYRYFQLETI